MSATVENLLMQVLKEMAEFRVETRFEFARIDKRFEGVDKRFEEVHAVLDEHTAILKEHSAILKEHSATLKEHNTRLDQFAVRFDKLETDMGEGFIMLGNQIHELQIGLQAVGKHTGVAVLKRFPR